MMWSVITVPLQMLGWLSSSAELPTDLLPVHLDVFQAAKTLTKERWLRALETPSKTLSGPSVPNKTEVQILRRLLCSCQIEVLTAHLPFTRCMKGYNRALGYGGKLLENQVRGGSKSQHSLCPQNCTSVSIFPLAFHTEVTTWSDSSITLTHTESGSSGEWAP